MFCFLIRHWIVRLKGYGQGFFCSLACSNSYLQSLKSWLWTWLWTLALTEPINLIPWAKFNIVHMFYMVCKLHSALSVSNNWLQFIPAAVCWRPAWYPCGHLWNFHIMKLHFIPFWVQFSLSTVCDSSICIKSEHSLTGCTFEWNNSWWMHGFGFCFPPNETSGVNLKLFSFFVEQR